MTTASLLQSVTVVGVLSAVAAMLARRFVSMGHARWIAVVLSTIALVQPAYLAAGAVRAVLLSLATYAVTSSGAAFVQRQDPRRVVVLAGSLAGAQLIDPLWGIMATVLLPVTLRRTFTAEGRDATPGRYVCLLFLPGLTMLSLIYFALFRHAPVISWSGLPSTGSIVVAAAAVMAAIPLSVFLARWRADPEMPVFAAVAATIVVTGAVAALAGSIRAFPLGSAALAVLSAFVGSRRHALWESGLLIGTNLLISWLITPLLMGNGYA